MAYEANDIYMYPKGFEPVLYPALAGKPKAMQ